MSFFKQTAGQKKIIASQHPESVRYWKAALEGALSVNFKGDINGREPTGALTVLCQQTLDPQLADKLLSVAKGNRQAVDMILTATLAALLHHYYGDESLILGHGIHGTQHEEIALPLRVDFQATSTFRQILDEVRATIQAAMPHLHCLPESKETQPTIIVAPEKLKDLALSGKYAMAFLLTGEPGALALTVYARQDSHSPQQISNIVRHFFCLLERALAEPDNLQAEIQLLTVVDADLVAATNTTHADYPYTSLCTLFESTVASVPDGIAVLTDEGEYTFAELGAASDNVAVNLAKKGCGAETIVAVMVERSFRMLAAIIGVLKTGAAYLPIDTALPAERIHYMLHDSGAQCVIVDEAQKQLLPATTETVDSHDVLRCQARWLGRKVPADALAYVIYTSGSTGKPKGVMVEHHSVVNRLKWMQKAYPLVSGDIILQKTPVSFDVSVWELFWWFLEGKSVCLLAPGAEREPEKLLQTLAQRNITTLHFVPTMLGAFLDYVSATDSADNLRGIKTVFASGEALSAHQVRHFYQLLPHARLVNLYGPTEATVDVTHYVTAPTDTFIPIGLPIDNTRLYVLDKRNLLCPPGVVGELFIAGAGLARGYLNKPELTAARFISGASVSETRLYRTGDLARQLPSGAIEYFGRNDNQVKLRGYRIELDEIEHALNQHASISDARVVLKTLSDNKVHLIAYVICRPGGETTEILASLKTMLPTYMIPDALIALDSFPLSPNGKLNSAALPEPETRRQQPVAPSTAAEKRMAVIWETVLGLQTVGINENFFSLGGNSIHFVEVLAKSRKQGFSFTYQHLFKYPTIAQLLANTDNSSAEEVVQREYAAFELISAQDRSKLPPDIVDAYPLSRMQSGMLYQNALMEIDNAYHDIVSYTITGRLDIALFRKAFALYIEQQPAFRTSYNLKDYSDYLQMVHRTVDNVPLFVEDLRHLNSEDEHQRWYESWFNQEQSFQFDWQKPGFVRLHIHLLSDCLYRYSISQHNSALDGWSKMEVHTALFTLYNRLLAGEEVVLPAAVDHFRNYIGIEQATLRSTAIKTFWGETLKNSTPTVVPRIPFAAPGDDQDVSFASFDISRELSDGIIQLADQLNVPVKNVLLAAHLKLLSVIGNSDDILTGYEHSGRPELSGADRTLGIFTNSMPLRVQVNAGSWSDLIRQTYETEITLLPYRRYPLAQIKQDLKTTETLFETVFNFVHFYTLKKLKDLPAFSLQHVQAGAITEFALRVEFSRHFYTDDVELILQYQSAQFSAEQIARIGGYLIQALQQMVLNPQASHTAASLLGQAEATALEQFSQRYGSATRVVDRHGNLLPIGSRGIIHSEDPDVQGQVGRWLEDGTLEIQRESELLRECASVAPLAVSDSLHQGSLDKVAAIWAEVLNTPASGLAIDTDFFDIGGSSLGALRAVLLLDSRISLREFMQNSRLSEQAELLSQRASAIAPSSAKPGLLVPLGTLRDQPQASLVCLPYAGGNAIHFAPFAQAVKTRLPAMNVYGVELPGHDLRDEASQLRRFSDTARLITDDIVVSISGPVMLWGHCVGSAMALEVARLLQARDIPVIHLFLAARLLDTDERLHENIRDAEQLHFKQIQDFFEHWNGSASLQNLGKRYEDQLVASFRHDSLETNHYLLARKAQTAIPRLAVPASVVIADDDWCTSGYQEHYKAWEQLLVTVELSVLNTGGHFFASTCPDDAAARVEAVVHRGTTSVV